MILKRYPSSKNRSLRPWNAGDEYVLKTLPENLEGKKVLLVGDRFGYLSCHLHHLQPTLVADKRSQVIAISENLKRNELELDGREINPSIFEVGDTFDFAVIIIPKSIELFEFYLSQVSNLLNTDSKVVCPFMTRNFSPRITEVAAKYFEEVSQSLAWKKSRLLQLSNPKSLTTRPEDLIQSFKDDLFGDVKLKQYPGVFSTGSLDIGTRFLLENIELKPDELNILDVGSGNGVISVWLRSQKPEAELCLVDDSYLAVESSKLNLNDSRTTHIWADNLNGLTGIEFDLIVSNPPFHQEYETDVEVSIRLFKQVKKVLKQGGRFVIVANRHLNYGNHLKKLFPTVNVTHQNEKFEIIESSH